MKLPISAFALALCLGTGLAQATERTVTLAVDNMTCASCPYIVKQTLSAIAGVHRVDVSFKARTAAVMFDDAVASPAVLTEATTKAGYPSKVTQ
jgi:mercuric ion binding protein